MENFKFQTIMLQILNINLGISNKIFSTIKFEDEKLEHLYLQDEKEKLPFNNLLTDTMIILGYIASLSYIILASYQESMLIMTILSLVGSTILIILSNISKDPKLLNIFSHLKIFLINVNLNMKAIIMSAIYNTKENDNSEEIMRVVIYDYFSTNLFILVKLESHLLNYVFYFLLNLVTVIFAEKYSNVEHYYYLDAFTGFILFLIFYFLRRQWDLKSRKLFSEKYKFEKLFQYSIDFINGLNGYHINLKNNNIIFMDNRFKEMYNELDCKNAYKLNEFFTYNPLKVPQSNDASDNKNSSGAGNNLIEIASSNNNNNNLALNTKYEYFKIDNNSALMNSNNLSFKIDMPSNLIRSINNLNKNQKHINVDFHEDSKIISKKESITPNKENEIKFNLFLDSLIYFEGKKFNILYENLFNDNISLFNENENINIDDTINTYTEYMNQDRKINYFKNFSANHDKRGTDRNDLIAMRNQRHKNVNENVKSIFNDNNNNLKYESEKFNSPDDNKNDDQNKKKSLLEELKYIQSSQIIIQEKFSHLGIYYFNENTNPNNSNEDDYSSGEEGKKSDNNHRVKKPKDKIHQIKKGHHFRQYFDVYLRRIRLNDQDDLICDIIFYDVTELVTTRLKIYEESITKQKIIAKIANEFKTPLNSIIGIVNSLNTEFDSLKEKFTSLKKIEQSLLLLEKIPQIALQNVNLNPEINYVIKEIQKLEVDFLYNFKSNLNFIGNLSNYLNILTNDIVHYKNNLNDIKVSKSLIKVKDLGIFCSEILKILLKCKSKTDRINIYLNLDEEIDKMFIYTDEIRIKQILLNFISNSVKFTKFGYISINCNKIEKTEMIKISIDDSGQGIREGQKKKIFADTNIFNLDSNGILNDESLNELSKNNFESGFGLYISKSLAKKLDCEIGFNSEQGKGSSFYLKIPFMAKNKDRSKNNYEDFEANNQNINFISKNLNIDEIKENEPVNHKIPKNELIQTEESFDKKSHKDAKEDSNLNEFEWSKILKIDKNDISKGTIILNTTNNFLNEMKNLNPNYSIMSMTNELEDKAILKEFYPNETERKIDKRANELNEKLNKEIIPKVNKLSKNVSLKKLNSRQNEEIFNDRGNRYEERICTIKEVTIENYNDLSILSNGQGVVSVNSKEKTTNQYANENQEVISFFNSSYESLKSTPKILIVQDNQYDLQTMKNMVESIMNDCSLIYNLKTFSDGEELIDEVIKDRREGFKINCIILDENIKRLTGLEVLNIIKDLEKEGKIKKIKVICTTSNDGKDNEETIIRSGADVVLKKPVSKDNLCFSLKKHNVI